MSKWDKIRKLDEELGLPPAPDYDSSEESETSAKEYKSLDEELGLPAPKVEGDAGILGQLEAAATQSFEGLTSGNADEIAGGTLALAEKGLSYVPGTSAYENKEVDKALTEMGFKIPQEELLDTYKKYKSAAEERRKKLEEEYPVTSVAGELGGAMAQGVLAPVGKLASAAKAAYGARGSLAALAGLGGASGALSGLGKSEADVLGEGEYAKALDDSFTGMKMGAITGAGVPLIGKGLSALGSGAKNLAYIVPGVEKAVNTGKEAFKKGAMLTAKEFRDMFKGKSGDLFDQVESKLTGMDIARKSAIKRATENAKKAGTTLEAKSQYEAAEKARERINSSSLLTDQKQELVDLEAYLNSALESGKLENLNPATLSKYIKGAYKGAKTATAPDIKKIYAQLGEKLDNKMNVALKGVGGVGLGKKMREIIDVKKNVGLVDPRGMSSAGVDAEKQKLFNFLSPGSSASENAKDDFFKTLKKEANLDPKIEKEIAKYRDMMAFTAKEEGKDLPTSMYQLGRSAAGGFAQGVGAGLGKLNNLSAEKVQALQKVAPKFANVLKVAFESTPQKKAALLHSLYSNPGFRDSFSKLPADFLEGSVDYIKNTGKNFLPDSEAE